MKTILIFIILIIISASVSASSIKYDCSFMTQASKEISDNPNLRAKNNLEKNDIYFLTAGVGIASSLTGINLEEFICVGSKYKTKVIWGGGDVMACKGQYKLGKSIMKYVGEYNTEMRKQLIESSNYECSI